MTPESEKEGKNDHDRYLERFMVHHSIQTIEELLILSDEDIYQMDGCTVQLLLEIKAIRENKPFKGYSTH